MQISLINRIPLTNLMKPKPYSTWNRNLLQAEIARVSKDIQLLKTTVYNEEKITESLKKNFPNIVNEVKSKQINSDIQGYISRKVSITKRIEFLEKKLKQLNEI